jgi:dTDP-4-dehydrorhamnose 3,5-epimerase
MIKLDFKNFDICFSQNYPMALLELKEINLILTHMQLIETCFSGLWIIQPQVFMDDRGYFYESYNQDAFARNGIQTEFVQDNQSKSMRGVIRGLHFQSSPFAQSKLVRVTRGAVLDVVLDVRKESPTYGKHFSLELNDQNHTMLLIPEGFAHGFATLNDDTIFQYKCSKVYNKASEMGVLWNDPELGIKWPFDEPVVSDKDKVLSAFSALKSPF